MIDELAARVRAASPRCGATRLVCVDGPSGAGKTTFATGLAGALDGAPVVAMDDLYPGWYGLEAAVPLLHEHVIESLVAGRAARSPRWDWARSAYGPERDLGTPPVLVVEGVGAGAASIAEHAVLLVWLEAPAGLRFRRGMARDGGAYAPFWTRWAAQERTHFAAQRTRERADVIMKT